MKIFLHIGPHKTGTTSIQAYLLARFGRRRPRKSVWYPAPDERGPGHAQLAAQLNRGPRTPRPNELDDMVRRANDAGVERLVLSSEDFIGGFPKRLADYGEPLESHDVCLLTTQNPVSKRIASLWQENVKHGFAHSIADSPEAILKRRGVRPGVVTAFAEALQPRQIAIIYSDPQDPAETLIERFLAAIGEELKANRDTGSMRHNTGLGLIEVEVLRSLNEVLAIHAPGQRRSESSRALREVLTSAFRSNEWRANCPQVDIQVPANVAQAGRFLANLLTAEFEALEDHWDVTVSGDPAVLAR